MKIEFVEPEAKEERYKRIEQEYQEYLAKKELEEKSGER
jgi:hypothetical protein